MPASAARQLSLSRRAVRDIVAIEAYYAQFGLATADRVVASIKAAIDGIVLAPLIAAEGVRQGTRHKVVGKYPYTIVYRVKRNGIQVVRVLHQRREYFNAQAGSNSRTRGARS